MGQFSIAELLPDGRTQNRVFRKCIKLLNAEFIVDLEKRAQGLAKGERNTHAWIVGELAADNTDVSGCTLELKYNPYEYDGFTDANGDLTIHAELVYLKNGRIFIWQN